LLKPSISVVFVCPFVNPLTLLLLVSFNEKLPVTKADGYVVQKLGLVNLVIVKVAYTEEVPIRSDKINK